MARKPLLNFRIDQPLLERIDAARGEQTRSAFVVSALEQQLHLLEVLSEPWPERTPPKPITGGFRHG